MQTVFSRILIARQSPKNKCFVEDGIPLFVKALSPVPLKDHVSHWFLSVRDRETKSRYGWVKEVSPFTLDEFVARHLSHEHLSSSDRQHLETMFQAIVPLAEGTPVAATYSCRGVEEQRMEFTVHRIFFHKKK